MRTSIRGPLRGNNAPFVMHLERVCRLIEMGQRFTIEFNPCSNVGKLRGRLIKDMGLHIESGGDIALVTTDGISTAGFGLTLANYKSVWRCWQNGEPDEAMRRGLKWG